LTGITTLEAAGASTPTTFPPFSLTCTDVDWPRTDRASIQRP